MNNRNISLNRTEWEAFERKLNSVDEERERRAEAFLHEMDELVTVRKSNGRTEIDLPWLEDEKLLALLTSEEKSSEPIRTVLVYNDSVEINADMAKLYTRREHTEQYARMISAVRMREYATSPEDQGILNCA